MDPASPEGGWELLGGGPCLCQPLLLLGLAGCGTRAGFCFPSLATSFPSSSFPPFFALSLPSALLTCHHLCRGYLKRCSHQQAAPTGAQGPPSTATRPATQPRHTWLSVAHARPPPSLHLASTQPDQYQFTGKRRGLLPVDEFAGAHRLLGLSKLSKWPAKHFGTLNCIDTVFHCLSEFACDGE